MADFDFNQKAGDLLGDLHRIEAEKPPSTVLVTGVHFPEMEKAIPIREDDPKLSSDDLEAVLLYGNPDASPPAGTIEAERAETYPWNPPKGES